MKPFRIKHTQPRKVYERHKKRNKRLQNRLWTMKSTQPISRNEISKIVWKCPSAHRNSVPSNKCFSLVRCRWIPSVGGGWVWTDNGLRIINNKTNKNQTHTRLHLRCVWSRWETYQQHERRTAGGDAITHGTHHRLPIPRCWPIRESAKRTWKHPHADGGGIPRLPRM